MLIELTIEELKVYRKWATEADSDGAAIDTLSEIECGTLRSFNRTIEQAISREGEKDD